MRRWLPALILLLPLAALVPFALTSFDEATPVPIGADREPVTDPAEWDALSNEGYRLYLAGEYEQAIARLLPIAIDGHPGAQRLIGDMFDSGRGFSEDKCHAAVWYDKAARGGDSLAQFFLGRLYMGATMVPMDLDLAHYWLKKSATDGYEYTPGTIAAFESLDSLRKRLGYDLGPSQRAKRMLRTIPVSDMRPLETTPFFILGDILESAYAGEIIGFYGMLGCR